MADNALPPGTATWTQGAEPLSLPVDFSNQARTGTMLRFGNPQIPYQSNKISSTVTKVYPSSSSSSIACSATVTEVS